ncbi:hypothetical protein PITC_071060 [Penicillium italicum]|uniref:Uncharacterized protein n=1 Tax=Penicillium italicum TaxID=40296 RepID=A0A0A2KNM1_PENIT|nr:hypothetical protein PITC_071060 [Penicillium italicum]
MAQTLDLGRYTLRIRDSKLQLHLASSAHFIQPPSHETPKIPVDLAQSSNLESVWITEAPELELRFFVGGNWDRDKVAVFVSKLSSKLCDMEIWSDLGFSVELKTGGCGHGIDTSGLNCLELALHRECRVRNNTTGRTLPSSMTKPPDACPPSGVPVATLASIDIQVEYRFQAKDIPRARDCSKLEIDLLGQEQSVGVGFQGLARMAKAATLHGEGSSETLESQTACISGDKSEPSCEELFRLFDIGIQRLVISNSIKDPTIRVSQQDTIKSFADISPAVFDLGYRDAINQRGVTIPTITKAISSMLAGNKDPSTNAKLANFLELTHSHHTGHLTIQPQLPSCRTALLSSLWRVLQKNVPKTKPMKRRASMLSTEHLSNGLAGLDEPVRLVSTGQQQSDNGNIGLRRSFPTEHHEDNEESNMYLLTSESEGQLLDNFSEASFTDIGESTQTSLDTLFSTIESSQTSYGDNETMLLSEHGKFVDYTGSYATDYDPREDMEAHDTDIIMAHDF